MFWKDHLGYHVEGGLEGSCIRSKLEAFQCSSYEWKIVFTGTEFRVTPSWATYWIKNVPEEINDTKLKLLRNTEEFIVVEK